MPIVLVTGRVQGVYYRGSLQKVARSLELTGHVRNLVDGRVEFVAEGHEKDIQQLIDWSKKGPPMAKVEDVTIKTCESIQDDEITVRSSGKSEFEILY